MASKSKSRSSSKSQSPTSHSSSLSVGSQGHGRKSARGKDQKQVVEDEKESLAFKVLTADNTKKLADIEDVNELQDKMAEVLQITNHATDLKDGALLDYFVAGFWWGKEQSFNHEQLSALFTVIHQLLDNIKEKQITVVDNLKEFRKMLVGIGQEASQDVKSQSGGLEHTFDINQAKLLTDYVYTSLFQHYKLFEFVFCHTQAEEIIGTDLEVEVPFPASMPWPPPLDEGVTEEIYKQHIATPPPTPEVEEEPSGNQTGDEVPATSEEEGAQGEASDREADLLAQLSAEEVKEIMDSVFNEMLGGLQSEVATKLREKENNFISRINKIHLVADK